MRSLHLYLLWQKCRNFDHNFTDIFLMAQLLVSSHFFQTDASQAKLFHMASQGQKKIEQYKAHPSIEHWLIDRRKNYICYSTFGKSNTIVYHAFEYFFCISQTFTNVISYHASMGMSWYAKHVEGKLITCIIACFIISYKVMVAFTRPRKYHILAFSCRWASSQVRQFVFKYAFFRDHILYMIPWSRFTRYRTICTHRREFATLTWFVHGRSHELTPPH